MKIEHFTELYQKEQCDDIGLYRISFGKYKNKNFQWIYENDKGYVCFLLKKLDPVTNSIMFEYFNERIEQEAEPDEAKQEKKPRKPRVKKAETKELLINEDE